MIATRLIIVRRGCPHCREALKVINWINLKIPISKRIRIIDNFRWEEFGLKEHPITFKMEKDGFDGYPYIYIDGFVVDNAQKLILNAFLHGYLKKELLI